MDMLKVSRTSRPRSAAGALASVLPGQRKAEPQAAGAGAVKAIAITRGFVAPIGMDLVTVPVFAEITINGEKRTAIRFVVDIRRRQEGGKRVDQGLRAVGS